jgi:glycosyltransferase involved in cell wall biosynthesis
MTNQTAHRPADARTDSCLSVFLPNYNHGKYIEQALNAILAQSVQARAVYVVDDGSTDNSVSVIRDFANRYPVIRPVYHARNRGLLRNMADWLETAEDDFLYFAAADDVILPGLFEDSLALLRRFPSSGLCSALTKLIDDQGHDLGIFGTPVPETVPCYIDPEKAAALLMRDDSWFMGNATIYRRETLQKCGGFDADLLGFTDGYACRAIALTSGACFVPRPLAVWRRMDAGMAGRTVDDAATMHSVAERATVLMSERDANVFPPGYASRWRRRWMFGAAMRQLRYSRRDAISGLDAPEFPFTGIDRCIFRMLSYSPVGWRTAIRIWSAIRLRPFDLIPVLRRHILKSTISEDRSDPPLFVLHVITGLGAGGAEGALVNLLAADGDPSRLGAVAALVADGLNRDRLEAMGTTVFDVGMTRGRPSVAAVFRLARLIRRTRPTFVQSWMYHADLVSLAALWLSGRRSQTRLLWSIRCSNMDTRQYKPMFAAIIGAWVLLARFADAVIANSEAGIAAHRQRGFRPRFLARIYNGVDSDGFAPNSTAREKIRRQLGIADDALVVISVGRVDPMKDHDLYLRVVDRIEGVVALAVGRGTESLPDRPDFLRLGQRDDIANLLAASDVFVSTSRFGEGFSNVVAEAMSSGLPVVATDVGDARDIVGDAGAVVPVGDEDALVIAIRGLLTDPVLRRNLGNTARQRAMQCFGRRRMVEEFLAVYETMRPAVAPGAIHHGPAR